MDREKKLQVEGEVQLLPEMREKGRTEVSRDPKKVRRVPKIAFIIGPYTPRTPDTEEYHKLLTARLEEAKEIAAKLWRCGVPTICPHMNTAHMEHLAPYELYTAGYIEILKRCDFAVLMKDWENSPGALKEVEVAKKRGIPVYTGLMAAVDSLSGSDVL